MVVTYGGLTEKQMRVLEALRAHYEQAGVPPTIRELGAMLELSAATVHEHLVALTARGLLRKVRRLYVPA